MKMTTNRKIAPRTARAAWCNGHYDGLLLIETELDAGLGFHLILNVLVFLCVSRDEVE